MSSANIDNPNPPLSSYTGSSQESKVQAMIHEAPDVRDYVSEISGQSDGTGAGTLTASVWEWDGCRICVKF